jgi:hypothetical protein
MQHALHYVGSTVQCGQESCPHSFHKFQYLKAHLEKHHSHLFTPHADNLLYNTDARGYTMKWDQGDVSDINSSAAENDVDAHAETVIDSTSSFMNIIGQLQGKGNVCLANIQTLVNCMEGFLQDIGDFCIASD